jgi:hypothetical protein
MFDPKSKIHKKLKAIEALKDAQFEVEQAAELAELVLVEDAIEAANNVSQLKVALKDLLKINIKKTKKAKKEAK